MDANFLKWNTRLGWVAFAIALITYTLTVEPTVSFWDCGEYISTAAKLQVGHPPGAPLFQMVGAFFALFAFEPSQIALMVNMVSVLSSAFTILFMYWALTRVMVIALERFYTVNQIVATDQPFSLSSAQQWGILGASMVGSLTYTFSDSFWYSAVEAEVYAMASMLIAVLFWAGLRWVDELDQPNGNRWLLFISLIIGLSFGVHFMALLTIPSIGLMYFFKRYDKVTLKNFLLANIIVVAILLFLFLFLLPWTMALFGKTEIFMVNSLGLPFNSGTIFAFLVVIGAFYYGIKKTTENGKVLYNTLLLCLLFIFIGFSSWMMLAIRSNANPIINENEPKDAAELLAYYNREQYGSNPLFYGPQYTDQFAGLDPDEPYLDKKPNYKRNYETGRYEITNNYLQAEQNSDKAHKTFLPRMWSTEHAANYIQFSSEPPAFRIHPEYAHEQELQQYVAEFRKQYAAGQLDTEDYIDFLSEFKDYLIVDKPTFGDNLRYMFEYQFNYMYFRYLMWNFVGRQSDIQGRYGLLDGNWISGIPFIDEMLVGPQSNLPDDMAHNKGRNTYYFLPFILGLIGIYWHTKKDWKSFYVLLALFLFTSIALKIFLNERPFEPRERDYAVVGSFYVFAMWVGMGAYALYELAYARLKKSWSLPVTLAACLLAAPILMASENWDDHDRSNRYTALAMARTYLNSCDENAILFTIGDNDTFPLWYAQEIEEERRDIRIVNTSLFMTDWYIDQMKRPAYSAKGLPISFDSKEYIGDKRDVTIYRPLTQERWLLNDFLKFVKSDKQETMLSLPNGQSWHFYPTNKIRIPVDREVVIRNKVVEPAMYDSIVPYIDIDIKGGHLLKAQLMMLDVINNNNWERPIYFSGGSMKDVDYLWMKEYLQLDGNVYKLVPLLTKNSDPYSIELGRIDADKMYDIVMKWDWGNGGSKEIYHDTETRRNSISYRTNIGRLAHQLIDEGKTKKAKDVLDLAMREMPIEYYGFYTMLDPLTQAYYRLGDTQTARNTINYVIKQYQQRLNYFKQFDNKTQSSLIIDIVTDIERYRSLLLLAKESGDMKFYEELVPAFNTHNELFKRFGRKNEGVDESANPAVNSPEELMQLLKDLDSTK